MGKLFKILKDLLSREIIELVIEVIRDVKHTKPNINIGKLDLILLLFISGMFCDIIVKSESNLIDANIQAMINNTKLKPAFVINTGVDINLFSSFFIKENILLCFFIT